MQENSPFEIKIVFFVENIGRNWLYGYSVLCKRLDWNSIRSWAIKAEGFCYEGIIYEDEVFTALKTYLQKNFIIFSWFYKIEAL